MKSIPLTVCSNTRIEWLRIGNGSIRKVPPEISGMTSLKSCQLQSAPVRKLPKTMTELPALKDINISWTGVSKESAKAVLPSGVRIET